MKTKVFLLLMIMVVISKNGYSQLADWHKLIALKSSREDVEKIIGKPRIYFDTYGIYDTEAGKFHVWYSKGGCHKNLEGLQYKISPQKMTRLYVVLKKSLPLEHYILDRENYKKDESPVRDGKFLYKSQDESIIYTTIVPNKAKEFVYTISIQPSTEENHLLCKEEEKK